MRCPGLNSNAGGRLKVISNDFLESQLRFSRVAICVDTRVFKFENHLMSSTVYQEHLEYDYSDGPVQKDNPTIGLKI